jgi:hypothetical protein
MNKNILITVGITILFLGIAIVPSINAKRIEEENLVEYTTEVIGFNGRKRTVKLTHEQSRDVELILDSIHKQLESSKSIEESKEIYKNGVNQLDKYGLSAGWSIEEAQKLLPRDFPLKNRFGIDLEKYQNIFCLLFGTVYVPEPYPGGIVFCYPISLLFLVGLIFGYSITNIGYLTTISVLEDIGMTIFYLISYLTGVNPLKFMNLVASIGCDWDITSFGLKGIVKSEFVSSLLGYTGLMIYSKGNDGDYNFHFLGFCLGFI